MGFKRYPHLIDPWYLAGLRLGDSRGFEVIAGYEHSASLSLKRLEHALRGEIPDEISASSDDEVFSFWLLLLALKAAGSVYLLPRVIDVEVSRIARFLEKGDLDTLHSIARALGIRVERRRISFPWVIIGNRVVNKDLVSAIPVQDFLRYASRSKMVELRLVNNFVKNGYVYVDRDRLVKLLVEASRIYILEKLGGLEVPETHVFQKLVESVRGFEAREATGFDEGLLPDCIKSIIVSSKARRLSDEELYVLLSFLSSIGAPVDYIRDVLVDAGLAPSDKAEVIAESLLKLRSYTPYKCEELKIKGICSCGEDLVKEYTARVRTRRGRGRS